MTTDKLKELALAAKAAEARYALGEPERGDQDAIVDFGLSFTPDAILALIRERDEALAALNHAKLCVRQIEISAGAINGFASQIKAFPATLTKEPPHAE